MWSGLRQEARDIIKGCFSVVIVTLILGVLQYIGAHVPEILDWLSKLAAGVAGIKIARK